MIPTMNRRVRYAAQIQVEVYIPPVLTTDDAERVIKAVRREMRDQAARLTKVKVQFVDENDQVHFLPILKGEVLSSEGDVEYTECRR